MHSSNYVFKECRYSQFVADVVDAASVSEWSDSAIENATHLINGAAAVATSVLIPASIRALNGIFFTDRSVAEKLIDEEVYEKLINGGSIFDPACGAGDLLLAAASVLPIGKNIDSTISIWANCLGGCDISAQFVDACKARLVLLAIKRHGFPLVTKPNVEKLKARFKNIVELDYLETNVGGEYDVVITNPPYFHEKIECDWASGKTQVAGIFVTKILERGKPGQVFVGILPDVLRSGSRYKRWRNKISLSAAIVKVDIFGRFSEKIDVDVFILKFKLSEIGQSPSDNWVGTSTGDSNLSHLFDVFVGGVVPHRHDDIGERFPYLTAKNTKPYAIVESIVNLRGFGGKKYDAPFLIVRRTSNPGDVNRVVVSLIKDGRNVAVENHLIVIVPKVKSISLCEKLLTYLQGDFVKTWINQQIRCRHLTTGAIKNIPIPEWDVHDNFTS